MLFFLQSQQGQQQMPIAIRVSPAAAVPPPLRSQSSPYERHAEMLAAVCATHHAVGYMPIVDVPPRRQRAPQRGEAEAEEGQAAGERGEDNSNFTEIEMKHTRVVLITRGRADLLKQMHALVLGEQVDQDVVAFNTTFAYEVVASFAELKV